MENFDKDFLKRLEQKQKEFDELETILESVEVMMDNKLFLYYQKKSKTIYPLIQDFEKFKKLDKEITDNEELKNLETDENIKKEIDIEIQKLKEEKVILFEKLKKSYKTLDGTKTEKAIIELRLKSGSSECYEIVKTMIQNFAKQNSGNFMTLQELAGSSTYEITGENIYQILSNFSGNCKIINRGEESICSMVVLLDKNQNFEFNMDDVLVETFKSGGAGGQHINKTESAVRLIHKPTGIISVCQDERSQTKNKERAIENLKIKLQEILAKNTQNDIDFQRKKTKNALFSSTPVLVLDFDKNQAIFFKIKKSYNLKQILDGNLEIISNDVGINDKKI